MSEPATPTRYLLVWMDNIEARSLVRIRRDIEDAALPDREQVEIDVWIESGGGDGNTAYKLALMLRHAACRVRVVVPDYAKSAATLLALVGDEIYLAPGAELGPLDAQMPEEGKGTISALNIARASDAVASDAVAIAARGGAELLYHTGLSRTETLNAMLRFAASFSEPLVRQLDPKMVHNAKEWLRVTTRYAERLLTKTLGVEEAKAVATKFVEEFPTHGYVISYDDAETLGLPVRPLDAYDLLRLVRVWHRVAEDGDPIVAFGPLEDFVPRDEDDDEDTGGEKNEQTTAPTKGEGEQEPGGTDNGAGDVTAAQIEPGKQ
jgi:Serine dehydrogenase proteinase